MSLPASYARLFIRQLAWTAAELTITLRAAAEAAAKARLAATATGAMLTGTSANGHSVTFALPPGEVGPTDLVKLCSDILDALDEIDAATPPPADDAARLAALLARFVPVRSTRPDFGGVVYRH